MLFFFFCASFPHWSPWALCATIITLVESVSGHMELMVVIGGLRQHGLQLLRTSVAHKIRVTSALIN